MGKKVKKRKKQWVQCPWCGFKPTGKLSWRKELLMRHYDSYWCEGRPHPMPVPIEPIAEEIE